MNSFRMAQYLHNYLVKEVSRLQQRILVEEALVAKFGNNALPTQELLLAHNSALKRAPETIANSLRSAYDRIEDHMAMIREIEEKFEEKNEKEMDAFAEYLRDKYKKK